VIALVDGEQEQRVPLRDAGLFQPMEERLKGRVVLVQLRLVTGLAGTERVAVVLEVLVVVNI
jgi:hypothetical protein